MKAVPYPKALRKDKLVAQYKKFEDMIKNVMVTLPLIDMLKAQEPKIPKKLGDPGKFVFPCKFGNSKTFDALADLGASINLMPLSLYEILDLRPLSPSRIRIKAYNHSYDSAMGLAEYIGLPVEDLEVLMILGRPFLATADTIILCQRNQLNIGVGNDRITINIREAMKQPSSTDDKDCYAIELVDEYVNEEFEKLLGVDTTGFNELGENGQFDLEADFKELMNVDIESDEFVCEQKPDESYEAIPNEDRF
ncbi:uncharacterized protein [Rutidosis leptorrhynchoides]|uniref:uncharacterized protein n=1 Tax=Rutidosis leptorrhynchoides TaxID=125765 RepID=UPI003A9929C2